MNIASSTLCYHIGLWIYDHEIWSLITLSTVLNQCNAIGFNESLLIYTTGSDRKIRLNLYIQITHLYISVTPCTLCQIVRVSFNPNNEFAGELLNVGSRRMENCTPWYLFSDLTARTLFFFFHSRWLSITDRIKTLTSLNKCLFQTSNTKQV